MSAAGVTEADVGEWFVKVGDTVKADDILVELETDKAAQEVVEKAAEPPEAAREEDLGTRRR